MHRLRDPPTFRYASIVARWLATCLDRRLKAAFAGLNRRLPSLLNGAVSTECGRDAQRQITVASPNYVAATDDSMRIRLRE